MHTGEKQFLCLVCNPQDLVWRAVVAWRQKREALIRNKTSRFSASLGLVGIQKRPCSKKTPWSTQFPQLPPPRKAVRLNERTKMGYISPSRAAVMCSAVCFLAGDSSLIRINTWPYNAMENFADISMPCSLLLIRSLQELDELKTSQLGNRGN